MQPYMVYDPGSYRGRGGRGRSYRGRGGRGRSSNNSNRVISHMGNKKLIDSSKGSNISLDPSHLMFPKIKQILEEEGNSSFSQASYAKVTHDEDDLKSFEIHPNEEVILLLENEDQQWIDDPWYLMQRYLDTDSYPLLRNKHRAYFEHILTVTESCEFEHFKTNPSNPVFTYSKIYIKRIMNAKDWGISTLKDREFILQHDNTRYSFNYWDYIEAFHKVFLYENPEHKHSWWVKFNPEIFQKKRFPNWIFSWWTIHGPSIKNLPEPFNEFYAEWLSITRHIEKDPDQYIDGTSSLYFFMEFGIPWIWKWIPEIGKNKQNIFCLKRRFYSKFWIKLVKVDPKTQKYFGQDLMDEISSTISKYQLELKDSKAEEVEKESPFSHILRKIQKRKLMSSKEEIMTCYLEEMKQDFCRHFKEAVDSTSEDTSMKSNTCARIAGESQEPDTNVSAEDVWESLKDVFLEKAKKKGKEKMEEGQSGSS